MNTETRHIMPLTFLDFFIKATLAGVCVWFTHSALFTLFKLDNFLVTLPATIIWFYFTFWTLLISYTLVDEKEKEKFLFKEVTPSINVGFYIYLFVNFSFMWPYHLLRVIFNFKDINWSIIRIAIERLWSKKRY